MNRISLPATLLQASTWEVWVRSVQTDGASLPPPTVESRLEWCHVALLLSFGSRFCHRFATQMPAELWCQWRRRYGFTALNNWIKPTRSMWWHLPKMTQTILGKIVLDGIIVSNKADGPPDTTKEELLQPDNCNSLLGTLKLSVYKCYW